MKVSANSPSSIAAGPNGCCPPTKPTKGGGLTSRLPEPKDRGCWTPRHHQDTAEFPKGPAPEDRGCWTPRGQDPYKFPQVPAPEDRGCWTPHRAEQPKRPWEVDPSDRGCWKPAATDGWWQRLLGSLGF